MFHRLALALLLCLGAGSAIAADRSIAAFAGRWDGSALSESNISDDFRLTNRDIDVTIRVAGDGFEITWNTVQRQSGNPDRPSEQLKSTSLTFKAVRPGVWLAAGSGDPVLTDQPLVWAHIDGATLVISSLRVYADGRHELQIYRRTLFGSGMQLHFTRSIDGEQVRQATGQLVMVAK